MITFSCQALLSAIQYKSALQNSQNMSKNAKSYLPPEYGHPIRAEWKLWIHICHTENSSAWDELAAHDCQADFVDATRIRTAKINPIKTLEIKKDCKISSVLINA